MGVWTRASVHWVTPTPALTVNWVVKSAAVRRGLKVENWLVPPRELFVAVAELGVPVLIRSFCQVTPGMLVVAPVE